MPNHNPTAPHDPDVVAKLKKIANTEQHMKRTSYTDAQPIVRRATLVPPRYARHTIKPGQLTINEA